MATATLQVSGVRCERCIGRLAGALRGHEGIEYANANLMGEVIDHVSSGDDAISKMAEAFARSSGLLRQQKLMAERETPQFIDVTIGDFTFQISWPEYIHWRMGIQDICKTRKNTINAEIRRRLAL